MAIKKLKNIISEKWNAFIYCIILLFLLMAIYSISNALSRTYAVSVTMSADHSDIVKLYFDNSKGSPRFSEHKSVSKEISPNKKEKLLFHVPSIATSRLRLDPGGQHGTYAIYEIVVTRAIGRKIIFNHTDIFNDFVNKDENATVVLKNGYVEINSTAEDLQIVSKSGSLPAPFPLFIFIPIIVLTFFFYKTISTFSKNQLGAFFFPHREQPSDQTTVFQPLDGLRGFGALLVLAEHTWHPFLGAGHSGVLIFFALSGFLLTRPFVLNPTMLFSYDKLIQYGQRRLKRILPMYYFYIFLVYGLSYHINDLVLHVFFIEASGHLWTIPQEMLFYFIFPFIMVIIHYLLRDRLYAIIPFLLLIILNWYGYVTTDKLYLFGMFHSKLPIMLPAFLSGSLFSFIYFRYFCNTLNTKMMPKLIRYSLLFMGVSILFVFIVFSNGQIIDNSKIYAFIYRMEYGIAAALLIFILLSTGKNFLTRCFSNSLLCSIGVVSYSLYLIHPLVIPLVDKAHLTGSMRFAVVLVISYFCACFTYHIIERPFFDRKVNN